MLPTQGPVEERIRHYVHDVGILHATAEEVARATASDPDEAHHALDELVSRNVVRRFETPGQTPVYWS